MSAEGFLMLSLDKLVFLFIFLFIHLYPLSAQLTVAEVVIF